jgi:hypothetical protein
MALVPANETGLTFGSSALSAGDLIPPRVKVVQAQSDEVANDLAKAGDFYNTLTGENFGKTLRFIPLAPYMNRLLLVRDERRTAINDALKVAGLPPVDATVTGLACRSLDMQVGRGTPGIACSECPLAAWSADNTPPLCSETWNIAAMTELGDLIILSFGKSSAKVGKRLFSMLRLTRQAPWRSFYEAKTRQEKGTKGTFFTPEVTKVAETPPDELLRWAHEWSQTLGQSAPIDVTPEGVEEGEF